MKIHFFVDDEIPFGGDPMLRDSSSKKLGSVSYSMSNNDIPAFISRSGRRSDQSQPQLPGKRMFGILKFFYFLYKNARSILDPNLNPLRHAPIYVRWIASVLLFCFWCLAFGLYIGEPLSIAYNMLGHIAIIGMAFVTWAVFKQSKRIYGPKD